MTVGFLFLAPSVVGAAGGYRPPEEFPELLGAAGTPTGDDLRRFQEVERALSGLSGVTGVYQAAPPSLLVEVEEVRALDHFDAIVVELESAVIAAAVASAVSLARYSGRDRRLGDVLVNTSGAPTVCRMRDSHGHQVFHVDRDSVRDLLVAGAARQVASDGSAHVLIESVDALSPPVPGVECVQVSKRSGDGWMVEYRMGGQMHGLSRTIGGGDSDSGDSGDIDVVVEFLASYFEGDGDSFFAQDWVPAVVDAGSGGDVRGCGDGEGATASRSYPVSIHFFRAEDFDDAPGEFRTDRDFAVAAPGFVAYAGAEDSGVDDSPEALVELAAWMNRGAIQSAEDPANPPAEKSLDLDPYPVLPRGKMLTVTVPHGDIAEDSSLVSLVFRATALNLCMVESTGKAWVNATGGVSRTRINLRGGKIVAAATTDALRSVLESAIIEGGRGFILSVGPIGYAVESPVEGVREVHIGIDDHGWMVHRVANNERFSLVEPGTTVEDVVDVLGEFTAGAAAAFLDREWRDISAGMVPDAATRWQLMDSTGKCLNVGDAEVHLAVPVNYTADLDWFQVANESDYGDYITVDRHLGTQWSVMWGHDFGEERYYRRIVGTREDAEALIHAYLEESERVFLERGWELVDNNDGNDGNDGNA